MSCTRSQILAQARSWLGRKESDGSHKEIVDIYNSHKPLAVGYKLKYSDAWCSGFVSACAIACGATDIIPTEVGVGRHIDLFKKKGIWVERDDYMPIGGDIIVYSWNDSGKGECTTGASHIGYVEKCENGIITVIEGNYSDRVKRREIAVNGRYIRGFAVPQYDPETGGSVPPAFNAVKKKVYLSPSNQTRNLYAFGDTNEAVQCEKITDACRIALERSGVTVQVGSRDMNIEKRCMASDTMNADLHVPVHTNAFNGKVSGTRLMCYSLSGEGYEACKAIFDILAPLTPGTSENITANPKLYEVRKPKAPTAYIEVDFHDVAEVAKWIIENTERIGETIAEGVCQYIGVEFVAPGMEPTAPEPEKTALPITGQWDSVTTARLQQIFGTTEDGKISNQHKVYQRNNPGLTSGWEWQVKPNGRGSQLIRVMQAWAGMAEQDGEIGPATIRAFQKKLGTKADGYVSASSAMVKALQKWANDQ